LTTVSVGIVSHQDRVEQRDQLAALTHPDIVLVDDGSLGVGRNHFQTLCHLYGHNERRLTNGNNGCYWAVVLEDDAIPVADFCGEARRCLDHAPSPLVSLYNGSGYPQQYQRQFAEAAATDACWILHGYLRHAVGYCVEMSILGYLIDGIRSLVERGWAPDDAISSWSRSRGFSVAYANPSLVQHRDGPSVIKVRTHFGRTTYGRSRPRRAHNFGTPPLTWTDKAVTILPK
jgi:hypothetical protein